MLVIAALTLFVFEVAHRPRIARAPLLPPVAFPKPVARAGFPFVSLQDPRASVVTGSPYPYGAVIIQPASSGR